MNILSIDTEYSNFKVEQGDLIQLGILAIVDGEEYTFSEYAKPVNPNSWSKDAEKVHGITLQRAMTFQSIESLATKFKAFIDQFDTVFTCVGWNHRNDKKYIDKLIRKHCLEHKYYYKSRPEWVDVMNMAKQRKGQLRLNKFTLGNVAKYFGFEFKEHDALEDATITYRIYELLNNIESDDADYIQISNNRRMTEIEKRKEYISGKYLQTVNGEVYISKHATENKEAMRVILTELWTIFCS